MKYNGKIFFLDRNIEDIEPTPDRPLSKDRDALKKLYDERYEIYRASCDKLIKCVDEKEDNANSILKELNL